MSKKTPLSFLVEVQTKDALKKLEEVKDKMEKLKDSITIKVDSDKKDLTTLADNIKTAAESIAKAKEAIKRDTFTKFAERVEKAATAVNKLDEAFKKFNGTIGADAGLKNFMTGLGEVISAARASINTLNVTGGGVSVGSTISKSIEQAKYEFYKVENLIQRAQNAAGIGKIFGDTAKLDEQIEKLKQYRAQLEMLKRTGANAAGLDTAQFKAQGEYKITLDTIKKLIAEQEKLNQSNAKAASSVGRLSAEEQKLSRSVQQATDNMRHQSTVLADLKTLATQYLGVWGAQGFMRNIIQIGGQLEQQRLSIGAILGDFAAGTHLFEQIKALAVQSPFGVVELDKYTKQLSAYGFKQNELFDMTKRLADISAGAGTDVSRLALALGHVRAEGALTGYTLRQFAMNNVPMLQKLSERLSELEGRVVSASEIRKRVSNKEIGYEDVIAVMKDLTDEGGMFYNMQEVMSDAVNAKFKNLKDSMDIMYGEMAESGIGDVLKTIAQSLMTVTRNWESSLRIMGYVAAAWLSYRMKVMATNKTLGQFGFTLASTNQKLMAQRIIYGGNKAALAKLTATQVDAMVTQKLLTKEQLLNAVATKRLTVDQAELAAATFNVSRAELLLIARTGKWRLAMVALGTSIRSVGLALKGLLLNPATILFGVITAGLEIYSRWKQKNDEVAESINALVEKGVDGYKSMSETLNKYGTGPMDSAGYSSANSDMIDALQNYAPDATRVINLAYQIDDLAERYKYLRRELESTASAYAKLERAKTFASEANEATEWLYFDDTLTENLEKYIEAFDDGRKEEEKFYRHRADIWKALGSMNGWNGFQLATNEDGTTASLEKQIELLNKSQELHMRFSETLRRISGEASAAWNDYSVAMNEANTIFEDKVWMDIRKFAKEIDSKMVKEFGAEWKTSTDNIRVAWLAIESEINKVPGMTDAVRRELLDKIFNETWHFKIDFDTTEVEEKLPQWMQALQDELDGTPIHLKPDMSYEQIVDAMKKAHKTAQTTVDSLGGIILKAGIQVSAVGGMDIEKYKDRNPELYAALKEMQDALNAKTQIETAGAKRGIKFGDDKKKKTGSKKTGSSGTKKDTELEKWRNDYNELKAFYQAYKKLLDVVKDKDVAMERIQSEGLFGQFFKGGKPIYDMDKWNDVLRAFLGTTDGKSADRKKFQNDIMKDILGVETDDLKDEADKAAKEMQEYIARNADKFNLFKQIMEKTGDRGLASQAFADGQIWDDAANHFRDKLEELTGETGIDFSMTDQEAQEHFKGIQGAYDLWKKIVEIVRGNYTNALTKAADAFAGALTNQQKIEMLQAKIDEALSDTSGVDHSAEVAKWRAEIDKLTSEMFEFLPIYEQIFGDRTYKSWDALVDAEKAAREIVANAKEGERNKNTGKVDYYLSSFTDEDGVQKLTLTRQQLERLKKILDTYHKDENKKNPFLTLAKDAKELYDVLFKNESTTEEQSTAWMKFAESLQETAAIVGSLAGQLSSMFDALGNEGMAEAMDDLKAGMDSVNNISQGFAQGGAVGGIIATASEAIGWVTRLAQKHDKKLDKAIQNSVREVKKLQNAYANMTTDIERRLTGIYGGDEYVDMLANYKTQLEEMEKQRQAEEDKKKTDKDKMIDYDQQITEMRNTIKYFAEDMAKDLYDIDIKSWAQELTDAVVDAWAKGEDAADAWHDKVVDLVKDVTKNILAQKVVEAALQPALDFITDEMARKNGKLDEGTIPQLAALLESAGLSSVDSITSVLDAMKAAGYDMSDNGKSSSASSSIKSISEQTADLLTSYVNAIRADVSIMREMNLKNSEYFAEIPVMSITAQAQLQQLTMISDNTRRNADYAEEINNLFKGLRNGVWRMPVS